MSVPADRMAVRQVGDPNKIMGVRKPIFYAIIGVGIIFAIWLYLRSRKGADVAAGTGPVDNTQGLTAADIGGTPADNSFATQTDQTALEEQIQQLQDAMYALQHSNGGNGAGVGHNPGGHTGGTTGGTDGSSTLGDAQHPIDIVLTGGHTGGNVSGSSTSGFGGRVDPGAGGFSHSNVPLFGPTPYVPMGGAFKAS